MRRLLLATAAILLAGTLAGCGDLGVPPPSPEPPVAIPVSFGDDIQPLFSTRCLGCHYSGGIASFLPLVEGESHGNLVGRPSFTFPANLVEPGDPDASVLYNRVAGNGLMGPIMPQPPSLLLEPADVELIRTWIAEGAQDN